ncbi:putative zinc finger A20 and AN1 domain-containing stress-associated protein 5 [Iris pallida]|uniref:Zinc finger A20 and AN1 domain-containing stress-associated protein 5 n=1 Tax=Iris pallida TaxID=29817 RepID=A0AAX6IFA7_IRIPA|nr:putative zinc finger A20 and AN1 domain-containing stress-associated protein 5 [Iris pallida]
MAEEQRRWQEGHRLCSNNCGFFGSPATNDLCSNCYRDLRLKDHHNAASSAIVAVNNSLSTTSATSSVADVVIPSHPQQQPPSSSAAVAPPPPPPAAVVRANRCGECRKKVGLTGFRCRCGTTYCGAHRHPEGHACGFDFKSAGKEAIARANPLVKAEKLAHKI